MARIIQLVDGEPGVTTRVTVGDTSTALPAGLTTLNGKRAKFVTISVEDNEARMAVGTNPTQGVGALGHVLYQGDVVELYNPKAIEDIRFINHVNGEDSVLQVTAEY